MSAGTQVAMERQHRTKKSSKNQRTPDWSKTEIETRGDCNRVTVHFDTGEILYCYGNFSQKRCA
jgi:hypothetical protein